MAGNIRGITVEIGGDHEFLGFVYEDIIRSNVFQYALDYKLPFMPRSTGKWWGQICKNGFTEDLKQIQDSHLILIKQIVRGNVQGVSYQDHEFKAEMDQGREAKIHGLDGWRD